jgi:hypothetical protein
MNQQKPSQTSPSDKDNSTSSSKSNSLPPLRELEVNELDLRDWVTHPVTRYWFVNLASRLRQYHRLLPSAYVLDNADATHGRMAQMIGAITELDKILKAEANGQLIARQEDIKELLDDDGEE